MDEFIELHNLTSLPVPLHDTNVLSATNTWIPGRRGRLCFPAQPSPAPGGYCLVVSFDPSNPDALARFRSRYGLGDSVVIYGPYDGKLDNSPRRLIC